MSLESDRHRQVSNVLVPESEEELYTLEIDSSLIHGSRRE